MGDGGREGGLVSRSKENRALQSFFYYSVETVGLKSGVSGKIGSESTADASPFGVQRKSLNRTNGDFLSD